MAILFCSKNSHTSHKQEHSITIDHTECIIMAQLTSKSIPHPKPNLVLFILHKKNVLHTVFFDIFVVVLISDVTFITKFKS